MTLLQQGYLPVMFLSQFLDFLPIEKLHLCCLFFYQSLLLFKFLDSVFEDGLPGGVLVLERLQLLLVVDRERLGLLKLAVQLLDLGL
jgi:hypothetical protein